MFVGRFNVYWHLEQSHTKREKRTRLAYERARKRSLSRLGVYSRTGRTTLFKKHISKSSMPAPDRLVASGNTTSGTALDEIALTLWFQFKSLDMWTPGRVPLAQLAHCRTPPLAWKNFDLFQWASLLSCSDVPIDYHANLGWLWLSVGSFHHAYSWWFIEEICGSCVVHTFMGHITRTESTDADDKHQRYRIRSLRHSALTGSHTDIMSSILTCWRLPWRNEHIHWTIMPVSPMQMVAVWCSGNALVLINAVALHRARLVLGWVTAFG